MMGEAMPESANSQDSPLIDPTRMTPDSGSEILIDDPFLTSAGSRGETRSGLPRDVPVTVKLTQIPGYDILGELGRGGMGVVYQARQIHLNRIVALKMILTGSHAGSTQLLRFRTEAEAVARLQHPNIIQIHEIGEQNGLPWFSLEYCQGGALSTKLDGAPLMPEQAARVVQQLAKAMHAAHQAHVIHRDLKPANVLIAGDGTLKITDFGLAKKLDDAGQTRSGEVLGTPSYMAPEQAKGDPGQIGVRTDVYALGAILYECLTGRPPFRGTSAMDTVMLVLNVDPVSPVRLQSGISRDLETICLKCLEKDPAQRYESAEALADDLQRYQEGAPIKARPVGPLERSWRWCKRNSALAVLMLLVMLSLLTGAGVSTYFFFQAKEEARAQRTQRNIADRAAARSKAFAADNLRKVESEKKARQELQRQIEEKEKALNRAEFIAYASRVDAARQRARRGQLAEARDILRLCTGELSRWEHDFVQRLTLPVRTLIGHSNAVECIAVSPDGRKIASGSGWRDPATKQTFGEVKVWDFATGRILQTLRGHTETVLDVAFSPDGDQIVSGSSDGSVILWDVKTRTKARSLPEHKDRVNCVAFSPDGTRILITRNRDKCIRLWNAQTGAKGLVLNGHTDSVASATFSPDGSQIVSGSSDNTVKLWDARTGKVTFTFRGHSLQVHSVAFSPDGNRIASTGADLLVWDSRTGEVQLTIKRPYKRGGVTFSPDGRWLLGKGVKTIEMWSSVTGEEILNYQADPKDVVFSPDGKHVISGGGDKTVKVLESRRSEVAQTLKGEKFHKNGLAFSPDGTKIVSNVDAKTLKVWDVGSGKVLATLSGHTTWVNSVSFTPDGRHVITGSQDRTARVWDVATGKTVRTFKSLGHTYPACSPDGKHIAIPDWDRQPLQPPTALIRILELATGKVVVTLKGHDRTTTIKFSPDGKKIACASGANVHVWDTVTGKQSVILGGHPNAVKCISFSPDSSYLVSGCRLVRNEPPEIRMWDVHTGKHLRTMTGHRDDVTSITFTPDGERIVSGSFDKTVRLWSTSTGEEAITLRGPADKINGVAVSPDGGRIACVSQDAVIHVWDSRTGEDALTLKGHSLDVLDVAVSPDGNWIVSGSADKTVKVWNSKTGDLKWTLQGHGDRVLGVAWSPDGARIASSSYSDGMLRLWDSGTGKEVRTIQAGQFILSQPAFSPDSTRIAGGAKFGRTPKLWSTTTGKETVSFQGGRSRITSLAFSPDGKRLVVGDADGRSMISDAHTGATLFSLDRGREGHRTQVDFSPDGKRVIATNWNLGVTISDATSGAQVIKINHRPRCVAYSPDGRWIATGSEGGDHLVKLWDSRTGAPVRTFMGHTHTVNSVAFTNDGRRLVSGSSDNTIKVWNCPVDNRK